jgi:hypothetical protein
MTSRNMLICRACIAYSGEICTERPIERSRSAPKRKLIRLGNCPTTQSSRQEPVAGFLNDASHLGAHVGLHALQTHRRNNLNFCVTFTRPEHLHREYAFQLSWTDDELGHALRDLCVGRHCCGVPSVTVA